MNIQAQRQNEMVSKRNQQRAFLQRKIAKHEHTPTSSMAQRSEHSRMAKLYRDELKRLEAR